MGEFYLHKEEPEIVKNNASVHVGTTFAQLDTGKETESQGLGQIKRKKMLLKAERLKLNIHLIMSNEDANSAGKM